MCLTMKLVLVEERLLSNLSCHNNRSTLDYCRGLDRYRLLPDRNTDLAFQLLRLEGD
jgi:hypothetical protein